MGLDPPPDLTKSKLMIFSKKKIPSSLKIPIIHNNIQILYTETILDLGVTFDPKLTFKPHIVNLENTLRSKLGIMWRQLQPIRGSQGLRKAYFGLIQSFIDYGLPIWGMSAVSNLKNLEALHRKIIRFILNIPYND